MSPLEKVLSVLADPEASRAAVVAASERGELLYRLGVLDRELAELDAASSPVPTELIGEIRELEMRLGLGS